MITDEEIIEMARKVADDATGCTEDECKYVEFSRSDFYKTMTTFARLIQQKQIDVDAGICMSLCSVIQEPHEFERCAEAIRSQK